MTEKPKTGHGWSHVSTMIGDDRVTLGRHWSFNIRADPKRLPFVLSRYKFAAKMCGSGRRILELGCSEGIGAPILSEAASEYVGVDADGPAVAAAQGNWQNDRRRFVEADFLGQTFGE